MMKIKDKVIFISGIDTDAGKSYATGWLAARLMEQGVKTATLKFIQTGNIGASEDIAVHRRIMGTGPLPEDAALITAPIIYTYPASPHLSARIDNRPVDLSLVDDAIATLSQRYDTVLVEGAGGLMVPIDEDTLTIDYPSSRRFPVMLVTNGKLGSINHTILSLEALASRNIPLAGVLYNEHFDNDPVIAPDTRRYIARYLERHNPGVEMWFVPSIG